jgi:hypothetical protein
MILFIIAIFLSKRGFSLSFVRKYSTLRRREQAHIGNRSDSAVTNAQAQPGLGERRRPKKSAAWKQASQAGRGPAALSGGRAPVLLENARLKMIFLH